MTIRKLNFFILILITLMLTACGSPEKKEMKGDTTGVTDTEIVLGSWGPMTGPAALWGTTVKGADAYFKMINDEGGIHGRKIKFIFKDDAYDPSRTVPAVRELVQKDEIFAVSGGVGTAPCMAVMDFLKENNVPWVTPVTGHSKWTIPTQANIFSSFPIYLDEGQIMAKFGIEKLNAKKIGIVYQNDDFGKSGLVSAKYVLEQNDMEFVAELPVEISDTDLSSHVARLKDAGADFVILWVLPRQAAILLGSSAVVDFKPNWMASLVLGDISLMHNITKGAWEGVYFTFPGNYMAEDTNNEVVIKYKNAFQKYYPDERWGTFALGGFMWSELMVAGLEKTGKTLTRESFLEALASIKDYKGGLGLPVSFSKDKHLGNRAFRVMRCKSATEYEKVGDLIESTADVQELIEELEL